MSLQRCEGANLESVLEEVRARFGDTVSIVEANRLRKGGVGGFFAKERFEVVVDIDDDESPALTDLPAEYGVEATESFCERLLSLADDVSDQVQPARPEPATPTVSTEQPEFAAVLDSITRHMDGPGAGRPTLTFRPSVTATQEPAPPGLAIDARVLARLGLPEDIRRAAASMAAPAPGTDPSAWLLGLLGHLPVAPRLPQSPGSVIVVVGAREAALLLARQITAELGLDPDGLVIVSPGYKGRAIPTERRITAVDAAAEARSSWRRRPRPTVVAVDAPTGRPGEWARRVIDALEPTAVWGAVDATRKPEDLFEWSEQLGGLDALGVSNADNTISPAAVLECGIPVGRLDGRPATALLWASLLASRLAG
ncbi:MAG TPA: hypothetical protein VG034_01465 [Acidimicrobiia bacterium]|nr:hypothetical protein [Acidimicrobiia bacterium]